MKCIICNTEDRWLNVDQYRLVKKDMNMCRECGFVSYPKRYSKKDEMKAYYQKDYRQPPTVNNLYTGQRKLHYHAKFLDTLIKDWNKQGKRDPIICDIGAAYGLFLNWWRCLSTEKNEHLFPEAKLYGTELTLSYRRNAYHEFGIELTEDFDDSIDYDLITSYKSAEHIFDFDQELLKYRNALKNKNGMLYISVPTWFRIMHNFGVGSNFDIEYYYHPDHVNAWTEAQFRYLLQKHGFEIIQEDHVIYDSTYLCKLSEPKLQSELIENHVEFSRKSLEAIKLAEQYQTKGDYEKAVKTWPNFPGGWRNFYEKNRVQFDKKGFEAIQSEIIDQFPKIDPYNLEFMLIAADLYMRYAKWNDAIKQLKQAAESRPNCPTILTNLSHCYRSLSKEYALLNDNKASWEHLKTSRQISRHLKTVDQSAFADATNWIYNDNSKIPMPSEIN